MSATQKALHKLDLYLRAKYPEIIINTFEETRVTKAITSLVTSTRPDLKTWKPRKVFQWSVTSGLTGCDSISPDETADPYSAIRSLMNYSADSDPAIVLFLDMHSYIDGGNNPTVIRALRELAGHFAKSPHTAIFISPVFSVPSDLEKTMIVMDWPLPDASELASILKSVESTLPSTIEVTLNGNREKVIQALQGLTEFEATSVLLNAVAATRQLGNDIIPFIIAEKKQIIRKSGVLEFIETDVTMSAVGGLENLKTYAAIKLATFSEKAKAAGVETARGALLVGVPGTGKSLSAKAIAGGQMPLLRMDVGALMGSLVGESEKNMRSALKTAEAIAPAVLWIDELEKSISGSGGGERDGGTSMRVLGTLLTWMQETTSPIYIVATANDIQSLRPELIRRFDDVFFVDLPNQSDRIEILKVHLGKRGKDISEFDLNLLAESAHGLTGSEIEKVVKSGIETAFVLGEILATKHLLDAVSEIVPIAVTMSSQIDDLRAWSKSRARMAGKPFDAGMISVSIPKVDYPMEV